MEPCFVSSPAVPCYGLMVQVVQALDVAGTPYVTQDGVYIVVMDKQQHLLHVYEVERGSQGKALYIQRRAVQLQQAIKLLCSVGLAWGFVNGHAVYIVNLGVLVVMQCT